MAQQLSITNLHSETVHTDGPLTRGKRKQLESARSTPGAWEAADLTNVSAQTPTLPQDVLQGTARELFNEESKIKMQTPRTGESRPLVSPVTDWLHNNLVDNGAVVADSTPQEELLESPQVSDIPAEQAPANDTPATKAGAATGAVTVSCTPANTPACPSHVPRPRTGVCSVVAGALQLLGGSMQSPAGTRPHVGTPVATSAVAAGAVGKAATPARAAPPDAMSPALVQASLPRPTSARPGLPPTFDEEVATSTEHLDEPEPELVQPAVPAVLHPTPAQASLMDGASSLDVAGSLLDDLTPVTGISANVSELTFTNPELLPGDASVSSMGGFAVEQVQSHSGSDSPQSAHIPVLSAVGDADTPTLSNFGREDTLPTPAIKPPVATSLVSSSPSTPQAIVFNPYAFSTSAGSVFATPEVPIHTGMTPMTASDTRNAQRHIPAWNRVSGLVKRTAPLVFQHVCALQAQPTTSKQWAATPFMLLQAICRVKGWQLTVRKEGVSKVGYGTTVLATVNIRNGENDGRSYSGTGKNPGQLEAMILACSNVFQQLLNDHLVTGSDSTTAMEQALPGAAAPPLSPRTVRPMANPRPAIPSAAPATGTSIAANSSLAHPPTAPVVAPIVPGSAPTTPGTRPQQATPRAAPAAGTPKTKPTGGAEYLAQPAFAAAGVVASTPDSCGGTPHPGVGVRAPTLPMPSPVMRLVGAKPAAASTGKAAVAAVRSARSSVASVVHPPMRTGVSITSHPKKATIAAQARPTGQKLLKEKQKELSKSLEATRAKIDALTGKMDACKVSSPAPLRGMPVPAGKHIVFDKDGTTRERMHARQDPEDMAEDTLPPDDASLQEEDEA